MTDVIEHADFSNNSMSFKSSENPHVMSSVPPQLSLEPGVDEVDNPDYRFELVRLQSFENWPVTFIEPKRLATAGFYYVGEADTVRCFECRVEIHQWEQSVSVVDHIKHSQTCRFVKNVPCGNVPIDVETNTMSVSRSSTEDVCELRDRPFQNGSVQNECDAMSSLELLLPSTTKLASLGLEKPKSPVHPEYISYDARLRTFDTWPKSMPQKKDQLANAGFFYTGKGDQTLCYHCGEGLKDWEPHDDPWEQHAKWFSKCYYLLMVKGQDYVNMIKEQEKAASSKEETMQMNLPNFIQKIQSSSADLKGTKQENSNNNSEENGTDNLNSRSSSSKENFQGAKAHKSIDDARLCKICYDAELGVVFLPCRHMVTCVKCAPAMTTCAVCRQPVTLTLRAILS
ncbi:baculoviral IAP repeat-containing protein 8-like isoform X1 [Vespa velutina]|uniref:baculoviral IAP repeat-containing protein 8-like isoform X1 n=2 Tax=Vespa velutina TaxID=202808 RepID=UPI001FB33FF3|nr:baculoviral IAP repeat-containing protein 8-like isoform X1 [Vespa velutina]